MSDRPQFPGDPVDEDKFVYGPDDALVIESLPADDDEGEGE